MAPGDGGVVGPSLFEHAVEEFDEFVGELSVGVLAGGLVSDRGCRPVEFRPCRDTPWTLRCPDTPWSWRGSSPIAIGGVAAPP
jgi:hypothetical protein